MQNFLNGLQLSKPGKTALYLCKRNQIGHAMQNNIERKQQTAGIIIAALAVIPTFVLGMLLPCFFVLVPLLALMLYGMVAASLQLRA